MSISPRPANETMRLDALRSTRLLDSATEPFYEMVVKMATDIFKVPTAFVSFIDAERQWCKARSGFDASEIARSTSFGAYTILALTPTVVLDATADVRFSVNPLVTGKTAFRFYAGAPVMTKDGFAVGTVCLFDTAPRDSFSESEISQLSDLATLVGERLDMLRSVLYADPVSQLPNLPKFIDDAKRFMATATMPEAAVEVETELGYAILIDVYPFADISRMIVALGISSVMQSVMITAGRLRALLPDDVVLYHVGYARYAFLSTAKLPQVQEMAQRCLAAFDTAVVVGQSIPIDVFPHAGIVKLNPASDVLWLMSRLIAIAEQARLTAVPVLLSDAVIAQQAERGFVIVNSIRNAIASTDQFRLVFQPVVCIDSGMVTKVEALLRWKHPVLGNIPPCEFLPLVESTGFMHSITFWVIDEALRHLHQWLPLVPLLKVAVNIAASDLIRDDLTSRVSAALRRWGVEGHSLIVEVTETAVLSSFDRAIKNVAALKSLGVTVAIDDYGAGYSNLAQLQRIPADILKIDQSLVRSIASNARDAKIVKASIGFAHDLGYRVVIEGVETREVFDMVSAWGAEYAQGYLIARPAEAADVMTQILAAQKAIL